LVLGQIAGALGKEEDRLSLLSQAGRWQQLFDQRTFTLRPKDKKGRWLRSFKPTKMTGDQILRWGGPGFVEGTAYQYAYMLPHGIQELIALHGGEWRFKSHLADVFKYGQFTLWNEPDIAYPYLFTYLKNGLSLTQSLIRDLRERSFANTPQGLPGNDDAGTLSAWYVFSALGFYPVNPAAGEYRLGIPLFEKIAITLGDGSEKRLLNIRTSPHQSQQVRWEGLPLSEASVKHADLIQGGVLEFGN
jgi:predicted alpha-1,2-mannosidase